MIHAQARRDFGWNIQQHLRAAQRVVSHKSQSQRGDGICPIERRRIREQDWSCINLIEHLSFARVDHFDWVFKENLRAIGE